MSSLVDTLFGGTDDSAQDAQLESNRAAQEFIEEQSAQARADALKLFPAADINRNLGVQGAFNVLGDTIPQQVTAFQQGNQAAQQQLLQGLPQIQNALLGLPMQPLTLPQQPAIDTGFAQQQVPDFVNPDLSQQPFDIAQLLAGLQF